MYILSLMFCLDALESYCFFFLHDFSKVSKVLCAAKKLQNLLNVQAIKEAQEPKSVTAILHSSVTMAPLWSKNKKYQ